MRTSLGRTLSVFAVVVLALAPALAEAKGFGRSGGRGRSGGSSSSSSSTSHTFGSGSAPAAGSSHSHSSYEGGYAHSSGAPTVVYRNGGYYGGGYSGGYYGGGYGGPSYYSGWGVYPYGYYSYGYYPYFGAPPIAEAPQAPSDSSFSLYVGGMSSDGTFSPGGSLAIDGARWGFNASGLVLPSESLINPGSFSAMPLFSAHVAYSLIADPHVRVRFEVGASGIAAPGFSYYGPDLGASAQLALLGPLALEGSVHMTPLPARILDLDLGAALHFGGLGVKAGWRAIRLDDTHVAAATATGGGGVDVFNGPHVAVGLVF